MRARSLAIWRKISQGTTNKRILGALITIASLMSVTRLVSVIKELIVAWNFGTSDTIEAFLIAFLIPFVAVATVASSFNYALIPLYIHVREQEGTFAAQRLLAGVTVWALVGLGLATLLIVVVAPFYLHWLALGFGEAKLRLTLKLTYIVAPSLLFGGIGSIWAAVLTAGERFALVSLAPLSTPLLTMFLLLTVASLGVYTLAFGVLIGSAFEMLVIGAALRSHGISLWPRWCGLDFRQRQFAGQFGQRVVANILGSGPTVINRSMAAMLPAGSVAALNYGNKVSGSLITIFGAALGAAVAPYLSSMVARRDWSGLNQTLRRYVSLVFLLAVPVGILLYVFSLPIVRLLFERGSFGRDATTVVADVQAYYALQIPVFLLMLIIGRLLSSLLAAHITMWAAAINLVVNVTLNVFFIRLMGVAGIALSMTCGTLVTFCFMSYCAIRLLRERADSARTDREKIVEIKT